MKTLLVILMLGAGLVTVASADQLLDCTNNNLNKCCIDVHSIQSAIANSPTHGIKIDDNLSLVALNSDLTNSYGICRGTGGWIQNVNITDSGLVAWKQGDWADTIFVFAN